MSIVGIMRATDFPIQFFSAAVGPFSWLEIGLMVAVIVLLLMIWVLTHHQESHYDGEPGGDIAERLHAIAGASHGQVIGGNSVSLVQDENFFSEVIREIGEAERTVHFETFLWKCGEAGDQMAAALIAAARKGITVRILVDARGSSGMTKKTKEKLRDAGCTLWDYHPWVPTNFGKFNLRDHRKIVVLDGKIAYVGGHCVTDQWLKDSEKAPRVRDITARFRGPIVGTVQAVFLENWEVTCGDLFVDSGTFPQLEAEGEIKAHVASIRPDGSPSAVQILHYLAIAMAKTSIHIQNPYFLPDPRGAKALVAAARRGVDVRIMTPSPEATDNPLVSSAGHFLYKRLLEGGVRIFEYKKSLLHQKVITVDGKWCGIGSSNFDDRSFEINDEITIGVLDEKLASELKAIFEKDMQECQERTTEEWKKRSFFKRSLDGVCYLFNEQF